MKHFSNRYSLSGGLLLLFAVGICLKTQAAALPTEHIELAHHRFTVEIANTDAERERGLMFRVHMAADHGMLFIFSDAQPRYFWMKNTLIPLDIVFFDAHKRLINVSANTPPCKADPCPTYASTAPAQYVLELNAGVAEKLGIKPGVRFKVIPPSNAPAPTATSTAPQTSSNAASDAASYWAPFVLNKTLLETPPIQFGVAKSTEMTHEWLAWMYARGCGQQGMFMTLRTPEDQLRAKVHAGDLTAVNALAQQLIWDGNHDGRAEAKTLLHTAILKGSTCALATHNGYLLLAEQGTRTVTRDIHGRYWAKYTLSIHATEQEKERSIMNAFAWDLVYSMRTGAPLILGAGSTTFASRYHDAGFRPSAADYRYACQRANQLYQTLQQEREAEGLGPFDDAPPPYRIPWLASVESFSKSMTDKLKELRPSDHPQSVTDMPITQDTDITETGSQCAEWPVPKTHWRLAEMRHKNKQGNVSSNLVWIPVTSPAQSVATTSETRSI